jgi:DNA repair protein RadD
MSALFADAGVTFPDPRPFQRKAMISIAEGLVAGHKNQMLMAATGAGKTYLGLRVAQKALKQNKRVTFLCDRRSLIEQTSVVADAYGLTDHGIIQGDHVRQDWSRPLQIASVQTIMSRGWPATDVLIVDEAHTQHETWVKFAMESAARVIGLSATPFSAGLGKIFTNLINAATMHELTESGVLVPMRVLSCKRPDMAGAKVGKSGEWSDSDAGARGMEIIGDVVSEWLRHAENRKTIVFGATIAHCEELCRQFNDLGVLAATFTTDTNELERPRLLTEYRKPDSALRVLISVEALAKGFDVPDVGCVVDCRPLRKSLSTAIQMWGRGLRSSPATGKTDCLLLDHSGNITRFAEDYTRVFFDGLESLDMGEKLNSTVRKDDQDEKERTGCPKCSYKPFRQRCMSCGFEIVAQSLIAHEAGEMQEVVLGKKKLADDKHHLWNQLVAYTQGNDKIQKKEGFAKLKFKDWTGNWPPFEFSFAGAPGVAVTDAVKSRIKSENIRRAYAKKEPA